MIGISCRFPWLLDPIETGASQLISSVRTCSVRSGSGELASASAVRGRLEWDAVSPGIVIAPQYIRTVRLGESRAPVDGPDDIRPTTLPTLLEFAGFEARGKRGRREERAKSAAEVAKAGARLHGDQRMRERPARL